MADSFVVVNSEMPAGWLREEPRLISLVSHGSDGLRRFLNLAALLPRPAGQVLFNGGSTEEEVALSLAIEEYFRLITPSKYIHSERNRKKIRHNNLRCRRRAQHGKRERLKDRARLKRLAHKSNKEHVDEKVFDPGSVRA